MTELRALFVALGFVEVISKKIFGNEIARRERNFFFGPLRLIAMVRANAIEMRLRFTVGRLLVTRRVLEYLRSTSNIQVLQEIESCFNGNLVCDSKKLDRILLCYIDEVFEQSVYRYVSSSN